LDKKFFINVIFAGSAHAINVLFPLLYIPFVLPIIGIDKIGVVGMVTSLAGIFSILMDYSFNITGVRDVIENKHDSKRLKIVFFDIMYTKQVIFMAGAIVFVLLINRIPLFREHLHAYYFGLTMVFGQAISILFLYQAHENFRVQSICTILSRTISFALILLFVNKQEHYVYIPLFIGFGTTVVNLFALGQYMIVHSFKLLWPDVAQIRNMIGEGALISISNMAIALYMQGNIFFLGLFAAPAAVGYYSIFEKIILGIRQILSIFSNIIFPKLYKISKKLEGSKVENTRLYFVLLYILMGSILVILNIFPAEIIHIVSKMDVSDRDLLAFRLFSLVPLIVSFNIYPYMMLNITGHIKTCQIILLFGALLSVLLNLVLGYFLSLVGIIIAILAVEFFITLSLRIQQNKLRTFH
jgi:PST family polysaccharide transporter